MSDPEIFRATSHPGSKSHMVAPLSSETRGFLLTVYPDVVYEIVFFRLLTFINYPKLIYPQLSNKYVLYSVVKMMVVYQEGCLK